MRLIASLFALACLFIHGSVMAADGSSGCGPGWYILKENSMLSSFGRGVTNAFLTPVVTFGMTSGTSNCGKHSLVDDQKRSLHFATRSYDLLRQDVARGSGRHLDAYLATFGCNALARQNLAGQLQEAFGRELMLTDKPEAMVETTALLIDASPALQAYCS